MPNNVPTMLTIAECAKVTGLAAHYIRKLIWENRIVYVSAGKKYLINLERFIEFLNNGDNVQNDNQTTSGIRCINE